MSKKIEAELLAIKGASKDGMLHAEHVVAWASKHKRSALYRKFEWDDNKAARQYRLWQARVLIQLNIKAENGAPRLVSLSVDRSRGGGYRDLNDVSRDHNLSEILLRDALSELKRVQENYRRVRELTVVWNAIDQVSQQAKPARKSERRRAA